MASEGCRKKKERRKMSGCLEERGERREERGREEATHSTEVLCESEEAMREDVD